MKIKTRNIINHLDKRGNVVIMLDSASGFKKIMVSRRPKNNYVVSTEPHGRIEMLTKGELTDLIDNNTIYINGWK